MLLSPNYFLLFFKNLTRVESSLSKNVFYPLIKVSLFRKVALLTLAGSSTSSFLLYSINKFILIIINLSEIR